MYLDILFFLLVFFSLIEIKKNAPNRSVLVLFLLIFYSLSFLRWERGSDWEAYLTLYELPEMGFSGYEPSYVLLNIFFCRILQLDYTYFLFFQATILFTFLFYGIKQNCKYPVLSLLSAFVILGHCGIFFVRETIAITIVLYSFKYIISQDLKKYLLFVFIAICFHKASIVALPAYYLFRASIDKKIIVVCLLLCGLIIIISKTGYLDAYIAKFVDYKSESNKDVTLMQFLFGLANKLVFFFIFWYYGKKGDSLDNGLRNLYLYNILLYIVFGGMNITLARVSNYINIFQIIQISNLAFVNPKKRFSFYLIIAFCFIMRTTFSQSTYHDLVVPYKSIFNKNLPVMVY